MVPFKQFELGKDTAYQMEGGNCHGYRSTGYDRKYILPRFTEKGVEFIKAAAKRDKPFFMYWTPIAPHNPVGPNDEFVGKSETRVYGGSWWNVMVAVGKYWNHQTKQLRLNAARPVVWNSITYLAATKYPTGFVDARLRSRFADDWLSLLLPKDHLLH